MIEILAVGALVTVQDLGRPGRAALGVPRSGAFDRGALALANRLVGNDPGAAALEVTLGGLAFRVTRALTVALTGAGCPGLDRGVATTLPAGAVVRLEPPASGLRSWLAVRGGLDVEATLGSCATDTLSGLGPAPVRAGDRLHVGVPVGAVAGGFAVPRPMTVPTVVLGPRDEWFADPSALFTTAWTVRPDSDRVGVRLDGPALERVHRGELPSEPMRPGAVQVPPDGRPIVFGPDAPVTGGYPVIGVLDDLDAVAQWRPGDVVRFRPAAGPAPSRRERRPPRRPGW